MFIKLNHRDKKLDGVSELSVRELLEVMKFRFPMIVVKINGKLIKKSDYETATVVDGDDVEAIHLISGG